MGAGARVLLLFSADPEELKVYQDYIVTHCCPVKIRTTRSNDMKTYQILTKIKGIDLNWHSDHEATKMANLC